MMLSLILFTLISFLLYLYFNQPAATTHIPGPAGLPLIGNLFGILWKPPPLYYKMLTDQFGPLVSVQMGVHRVVIISSSNLAREVLARSGNTFDCRPKGTLLDFIMGGKGIVMTNGPVTQEARKLLHNSMKEFGNGKDAIETYIDMEVQEFMKILKKNSKNPFNPHQALSISILNIIWQMISGVRFEMDDRDAKWFIETIELSLVVVEACGFLNFVFILQALSTFFNPKALKLFLGLLRRNFFFDKIIKEHREEMKIPNKKKDFVFNFIENQINKATGSGNEYMHSDTQLKWIMSDLFVAGLETTSSTLISALLMLVEHSDIQEKLHVEVEAVLGPHRIPSLYDMKNMPYTKAFMNEVLRLYPAVPIVFRSACEDTRIQGSFIPKGTWIFINIWAIHMDSKIWGDPEIFRPERFLGEKQEFVQSSHHIAFSVGPKSCIGKHLALSEFFLFLTNILQNYKISAAGDRGKQNYKISAAGDRGKQSYQIKSGLTLIPPEYNFQFSEKVK